jgi:alcohol dehydrogenase class IV
VECNFLVNIVNTHYPDIRKMLNTIQLSIKDNKLVVDESIIVSSNYIKQVLKELKNKKTDYRKLRQIIADSGVKDFEELYRSLFDNAS